MSSLMTCLAAPITSPTRSAVGPPRDASLWRRVETAVALTMSVALRDMRAPTRSRVEVAFARQVEMYVAHAVLGMGHSAVGRLCGRDRKTVAYACHVVELRRDDPDFDRMLQVLGEFCRDMTEECAA